MKITRFIVGLAAASTMGLLFAGTPVAAESREEITISPATTMLRSDPGSQVSGEFKVVNTGETTLNYTIYARPYSVETEAYRPNYSAVSERSSVYKWVQFDQTEGSLNPGDEQSVRYTVRIPQDASPGGHYSVLFAETVPEQTDEQMVVRNKRVGSVVRLTIDGERNEKGSVDTIGLASFQMKAPLKASARILNDGNVDIDADTTLTVQSIFGRELYSEKHTNAVFPGQPRLIEREWGEAPAFGLFKVTMSASVLGDETTEQRYVLMMPLTAVIAVVIIVLAGVLYAGYRRLR